jgi:hypothetical protein
MVTCVLSSTVTVLLANAVAPCKICEVGAEKEFDFSAFVGCGLHIRIFMGLELITGSKSE